MDPISSTPFLAVQVPKSAKIVAFPKDGLEYVQNVMIERNKCLSVVSADYDNKINNCQNVFATLLPETVAAPDPLLPTKEWQIIQESDFSKVRCRLACIKNQKDFWKWPENLPKEFSTSHWKIFLTNHSPLLSIVFSMKQAQLEFAFSVLVEELEGVTPGNGIDRKCGQWIFAILAAFHLPLMPNLVSQLREMARLCSQIRSNLSPDAEDVLSTAAPLNLFICLVARYFNQGDLTD